MVRAYVTGLLASLVMGAITLAIVLLMVQCSSVKVGPFVPPGAAYCGSDADCKDGTHCAFPAPGWRPRCMSGSSSIDTIPEATKRRDAGP
jgi:hypothetical protein